MQSCKQRSCRVASSSEFVACVVAYIELLIATWDARARGVAGQPNPIPLSRFREWGIGDAILLWMLYHGHVEHSCRVSGAPNERSLPAFSPHFSFPDSSRFSLTDLGQAFAETFLADVMVPLDERGFQNARGSLLLGASAPQYDRESRVFTWGVHLVKLFRQPSTNQEAILTTAEELGWPRWFDDPLPRSQLRNPKRAVQDTIKDLNRRQHFRIVHFQGDGTGTRVGWELRLS